MRCLCESSIKEAKIDTLNMVIEVLEVQADTEDWYAMTSGDEATIIYHRHRETAFFDAAAIFKQELNLIDQGKT